MTLNLIANVLQNGISMTEDKVEQLIEKYGGRKFSVFVGVMMILALCSRCWWFYMIPWFVQEPIYECTYSSDEQPKCISDNFCNDPENLISNYWVDWSD